MGDSVSTVEAIQYCGGIAAVLRGIALNIYRTAVSPTLDLLCDEDFNVGRSEAESNIEIFMAQ